FYSCPSSVSSTMVYIPPAVGVITEAIPQGSVPTQSSLGSVMVSTRRWSSAGSPTISAI
ncbi:hypothetical protein A2U01_0070927, partial [Trifolium medium]|nr:hypothetical protein [Trifolium medium]